MVRAKPVEILTLKIESERAQRSADARSTHVRDLRVALRLISDCERVESTASTPLLDTILLTVHRFEHTIGERAYQIEVTPMNDRWRAQIRRLPGMPTAVMPFYGATPDEAARQLGQWLTLAHRRQTTQPEPAGTA